MSGTVAITSQNLGCLLSVVLRRLSFDWKTDHSIYNENHTLFIKSYHLLQISITVLFRNDMLCSNIEIVSIWPSIRAYFDYHKFFSWIYS